LSSPPTEQRPPKRQRSGSNSDSDSDSNSNSNSDNNSNSDSNMGENPSSTTSTTSTINNNTSTRHLRMPTDVNNESSQLQQHDVESLHLDLAEVERGLTQQRSILYLSSSSTSGIRGGPSHAGNAIFESFGSALTSIRARLQELATRVSVDTATTAATTTTTEDVHINNNDPSSTLVLAPVVVADVAAAAAAASPPLPTPPSSPSSRPSELLSSISDRLATAERAHSTRIPLGLLQTELSRHRSMGESYAEMSTSTSTTTTTTGTATVAATTTNDTFNVSSSSASSVTSDPNSERMKRRRTSVLVASRRNEEIHELHDVAVHHHARGTSMLPLGEQKDEVEKYHAAVVDTIELLLPESALEKQQQQQQQPPDTLESHVMSSAMSDAGSNSFEHYVYHPMTGTLEALSPTTSPTDHTVVASTTSSKEDVIHDEPTTTTTTPEYPPIYVWGSLTIHDENSVNDVQESTTAVWESQQTYQIFGSNDHDDEPSVLRSKPLSNLVAGDDKSIPLQLPSNTRLGRSNIVSVGISNTHMAFTTSTGSLLICGDNSHGAVDPSQRSVLSIPRPMHMELLALNRILTVSCGTDHTAAISETKSVLTWGNDTYGQLGHHHNIAAPNNSRGIVGGGRNHVYDFVLPKAMSITGEAKQVSCGDGFTLVLTTQMSVFMCGREEITGYNAIEGVADETNPVSGTITRKDSPSSPLWRLPEQNSALLGLPLVYVAAGSRHAVVLTTHGTAYAWGSNEDGQCGREYPKRLKVPVPMAVPKTKDARIPSISVSSTNRSSMMDNWDVWTKGAPISLARDVNIVHAACGKDHTVLVTKSGQLLVCGSNANGQLSPVSSTASTFPSVQIVQHPVPGRMFLQAEAGSYHTVILDDSDKVWELRSSQLKEVVNSLPHSLWSPIGSIAAGGSLAIAIAKEPHDSITSNPMEDTKSRWDHPPNMPWLDTLMEAIHVEHDQCNRLDVDNDIVTTDDELARRVGDLFRSVAVMNSLFMDPKEIERLYLKLLRAGHNHDVQQGIVSSMEKGMVQALESLTGARLMYPEAIRILLLFLQCPLLREAEAIGNERPTKRIQFDVRGNLVYTLCETILGMPFEGYKAFLALTTTVYGKDLFVPFLVKPLIVQLNNRMTQSRTYGVPPIAGVLRWLYVAVDRSEGQLAKPEDFYCSGLNDRPIESLFEDLARFKKADKADRAVNFYLAGYSFLMSPTIKRSLLQVENQLGMVHAAQSGVTFDPRTREYKFNPYFVLSIDRKYLLQQTLQSVAQASPGELRKGLKVVFKGEDGVDAGGVTKEFFQLLVQRLFDVNTGMWSTRFGCGNQTWFNSDCTWNDDGFYLVGVLTGLAFYNSVILDVHFPPAVYRKLLSLPLGLEDMVDDDVRKGLKSLLQYDGDNVEDVFCLNFEVTWMDLGLERKMELKPGGSDIPVTSINRREYVVLYVKWLLVDSIAKQYEEFERGFLQVVEGSSLELLRAEELELLVVGTPELDFFALEANTQYDGGFDSDSPAVQNLWRFIQSAPQESQLKFLKFCTGSGKGTRSGRSCIYRVLVFGIGRIFL
jgi:ubiquitin-protein ligase E3 A